jgi:hypothetical protein
MTGHPWDKPAVIPTPPTCHVCGEAVGRQPVIVAPPHILPRGRPHRDCYTAFHRALWTNEGKSLEEIRAVVVAAKGGRA